MNDLVTYGTFAVVVLMWIYILILGERIEKLEEKDDR